MTDPVPVIDISSLLRGRRDADASRLIERACRATGFFYVSHHGIGAPMISRTRELAEWFFGLPLEQKQAVARSETNSRGYYNQELTKNIRDMKEVFDFGHKPEPGKADDHPDNRTQDGWNQWPGAGRHAEFKAGLTDYFEACGAVAMALLGAIAANLGVRAAELTAAFAPRHSSFLRLNYYPVEDPLAGADAILAADTGKLGVHQHTDAGALTLLLQDEVGGLEIYHRGGWMPVEPVAGTLVVNIGDILQVWSNGLYRAPLHRVAASTRSDRYSLPYFFNPVYAANYAPLPALLGPESPARYREINWGHFRWERQHGDYGDFGEEIQIADFRI